MAERLLRLPRDEVCPITLMQACQPEYGRNSGNLTQAEWTDLVRHGLRMPIPTIGRRVPIGSYAGVLATDRQICVAARALAVREGVPAGNALVPFPGDSLAADTRTPASDGTCLALCPRDLTDRVDDRLRCRLAPENRRDAVNRAASS
jgi:hypothetical protein